MKFIIPLFLLCWIFSLSCKRQEVELSVTVDFSWEVLDNDFTVPVKVLFRNKTIGTQFYQWTFKDGEPATYDKREPGYILFTKPGEVKIKLQAWNDVERKEKEIILVIDPVVKAGFAAEPEVNNFEPTTFHLINNSGGATKYKWFFDKGSPSSSVEENPDVAYKEPGEYRIFLEVANNRGETDTISGMVTVLPALTNASFNVIPSFDDEDYEAPLVATLLNSTVSATSHLWSSTGGTISNKNDSIPTIKFETPGTYTINYQASNGKQTETISASITVKPNKGLRTFRNVKLGINTAHANTGSFFSTRLRKVFTAADMDTLQDGSKIDLVYFGLNEDFNYNTFISPVLAGQWTFTPIPLAAATKLVNRQETCACGTSLTVTEFDNTTNGSALQLINTRFAEEDKTFFDNLVTPRIVLFKNAAGKNGAIKITQFVNNGKDSYMICDIKVQKD